MNEELFRVTLKGGPLEGEHWLPKSMIQHELKMMVPGEPEVVSLYADNDLIQSMPMPEVALYALVLFRDPQGKVYDGYYQFKEIM